MRKAAPSPLNAFWELFLTTRQHHGAPPQPKPWFRNLIDCFGESLQIRVALKQKQPIAAILTLRHGNTLVYKYGGSDSRFDDLGGTHLLLWRSILEARQLGLHTFDLGRSEIENQNLITFKDRWGADRSTLTYSRFALRPFADTFGGLQYLCQPCGLCFGASQLPSFA